MISGTVSEQLEMTVELVVAGPTGNTVKVLAVIDTGFSGALTLPQSTIDELQLSWRSRSGAMLANGHIEDFDIFDAEVTWNGAARPVYIEAVDITPLLGMTLLDGHRLAADVVKNGAVTIETL